MSDTRQAGIASADELDEPTAQALWSFGLRLVEAKRLLGLRCSEWITGAPALEATVALAAITQDEFGHARGLLVALQDLPDCSSELREKPPTSPLVPLNLALLDQPLTSWFDTVAMNVIFDEAIRFSIEATRESTFVPLRQRIEKILQEEQHHRTFGTRSFLHLQEDPAVRPLLDLAAERMMETSRQWFDNLSNHCDFDKLIAAGIVSMTPLEQQNQWKRQLETFLDSSADNQ